LAAFSTQSQTRRKPRTQRQPKATPAPTPTPTPLATLSIEAGLVYKNGDSKPVARAVFYLLDQDPSLILESGTACSKSPICFGSTVENIRVREESTILTGSAYTSLEAKLAPHVVATVTTDFSGKAKFESLAPGTRFIYGEFRITSQTVAWDVEVELVSGKNTILILDNSGGFARTPVILPKNRTIEK